MKASLKSIITLFAVGLVTAFSILALSRLVSDDDMVILVAFVLSYTGVGLLFGKAETPGILVKTVLLSLGMTAILIVLAGLSSLFFLLTLTTVGFTAAGLLLRRHWAGLSKMALTTVSASTVIYVLAVGLIVLPRIESNQVVTVKNEAVPAFELTALDGRTIKSADLRGKVVLLNWWATWCSKCRQEMPDFNKLNARYKDNENLVILAVNIADTLDETNQKAAAFMKKNGFDLTLAFDKGFRTGLGMNLDNIPATVLIDKQGRARLTHTGFGVEHDFTTLMTDEIEKLIRE